MEFIEVALDQFTIVGISVRTSNQNGAAMQDIGKLWERFFNDQIALSISNKVSEDIYCIYTDYEGDFTGEYTTIIGCKVGSLEKLPKGCISKKLPASAYRLYKSVGKLPESVGNTWMNIWQEGNKIDRTYVADFDVYGKGASNPEDATVLTYLAVNK